MLADMADLLPSFYAHLGIRLSVEEQRPVAHLFPRALVSAGRRHIWDGVIRMSLVRRNSPVLR